MATILLDARGLDESGGDGREAAALARGIAEYLSDLGHEASLARGSGPYSRSLERLGELAREPGGALLCVRARQAISIPLLEARLWVHERAGAASLALAQAARQGFRGVPAVMAERIQRGAVGALDPSLIGRGTAACLSELLLGGADRYGAARRRALEDLTASLGQSIHEDLLNRFGPSLTQRVEREYFDVWHEVPLVPQVTGMSCWAAAAAMLIGWRDRIDVDQEAVARGSGRWGAYRDGLEPSDVTSLARAFGLTVEPVHAITAEWLRDLLERRGPLWIGEASPGLHTVVIAGIYGDGSVDGTFVRVVDPWPVGRGERYTVSLRELASCWHAAEHLAGTPAQVLHTGGRGASTRPSRVTRAREVSSTTFSGPSSCRSFAR